MSSMHQRDGQKAIEASVYDEAYFERGAVIPLGISDDSPNFVVPDYDKDITHITARTAAWWSRLFAETGWNVDRLTYTFKGVKENWTGAWPEGNAFFVPS